MTGYVGSLIKNRKTVRNQLIAFELWCIIQKLNETPRKRIMARQVIAQNWKIKEVLFDQMAQKFTEKCKRFGRYTAATAAAKVSKNAVGYRFVVKPHHGFGGYWVNSNGDTMELLPA
jgi:hypothetical protein